MIITIYLVVACICALIYIENASKFFEVGLPVPVLLCIAVGLIWPLPLAYAILSKIFK